MIKVTKSELVKLKEFTESLVTRAGNILLKHRDKVKIVKHKDLQDVATTADLLSEKIIIDAITEKFPSHSISSEEQGSDDRLSDFRWIIDPLDGTKEFVRGGPLYAICVALKYKNKLITSAVYIPEIGRLYSAGDGMGSFLNGKKISVSGVNSLTDSFAYFYFPNFSRNKEFYDTSWQKIAKLGKFVYRVRSLSNVNIGLSFLAQGMHEAYIDISNPPKEHDIAPGFLIAKEAGALLDYSEGRLIATNNKSIYNELKALIK